MANPMKMMQQVQKMQAQMEKLQADLGVQTIDFSAGGGMVTATASCDGNLKGIKIDPKVVDPEDVEMLEDLVLAAVEGALQAGRDKMAAEMAKVTEGLKLPAA